MILTNNINCKRIFFYIVPIAFFQFLIILCNAIYEVPTEYLSGNRSTGLKDQYNNKMNT